MKVIHQLFFLSSSISTLFLGCETDDVAQECRANAPLSESTIIDGRTQSAGELIHNAMLEKSMNIAWTGINNDQNNTSTTLTFKAINNLLTSKQCAIDIEQNISISIAAPPIVSASMQGTLTLNTNSETWYLNAKHIGSEWGNITKPMIIEITDDEEIESFMIHAIINVTGELSHFEVHISTLENNGKTVTSRKLTIGSLTI